MAPVACPAKESPSIRATLARERLNSLPDGQIVYVDRLGPRILAVPPDPAVRLSHQTLRELTKGNLTGRLGQGARFLSKWMIQCPEITINANGHYTVQKKKNVPNAPQPRAFTVKTLDIWTGKPGEPYEDRNLDDLIFYSVGVDELPSYHSWNDDKLERRESSLELERQQEAALAEQEFLESPKSIADVVDEYKEKHEAKMDEIASNDPENMLRFKPDILPSDPAWEGVEEYFKWILQFEREEAPEAPQVYRVLQDELVESQLLLAIPATNSGYRAKIQDENTERYHEALRTTFQGKPDNLVTKLAMLCFGLPVEPLTVTNVKFAGGLEDVPSEDNKKQGPGQMIERIVWSEKPLEFLDYYNERSYGFPMIRTQKRKYEEVDTETMVKLLMQAQERSKHPRLLWDGCGVDEIDDSEQGPHLRGGAGSPAEVPNRTFWLYTDMGRFIMNVDNFFPAFYDLTYRLFRLEVREDWTCQIDFMPVLKTDSGAVLDTTKVFNSQLWGKSTKHEHQPYILDSYATFVMDSNDTVRFRVRYNPNFPVPLNLADFWEPKGNQTVVNLEVSGVGIAYWFLPSSPEGVNILQDTFRNAVECLIPRHRQYIVQWVIQGTDGQPDKTGRLLLMAEAPSVVLWNATQEALGSGDRVKIHLTVLEGTQCSQLAVKILMPGFNQVAWYDRLPDNDLSHQNREIFGAVRNFVHLRTIPDRFPVRIWAGVQLYDDLDNLDPRRTLSLVLPAETDLEVEADIWESEFLALTWDAIVVRPNFHFFMVICMTDRKRDDMGSGNYYCGELQAIGGLLTLARFRDTVREISEGFNQEEEYISIEQAQSGHTFLIGPGMTERQWHTQVFEWFDSPTIRYRTHRHWPIRYAKELIDGPLGPTYNGVAPPSTPPPEQMEEESLKTPPLLDDPPLLVHATGPVQEPPTQPLIDPPTGPETDLEIETGTQPVPVIPTPIESPIGPPTGEEITGPSFNPAGNDPLSRGSGGNFGLESYQEYRKRQAAIEQRRVEAYSQDESIHKDGQFPQIPMFGPAFEGNIPVAGSTVPTIFTAMSTPTENVERDRELEALQKIVLQRLDYCGICRMALPAGPHNLEERECHFQKHRDIEAEARRNALGNFAPVSHVSVQEVFYCEYCGKTPAEFERDNNGMKHGPSCALRATFHDVPQYCQYCRLNFWDNDMTNETVRSHVGKCAKIRHVSPQGQINLYQQLLSVYAGTNDRTHLGQGGPGPKIAGNRHCPFPDCGAEFEENAIANEIRSHFRTHLPQQCSFPDCGREHSQSLTDKQKRMHMHTYCSRDCQWPGCENVYIEEPTGEAIIAHILEHARTYGVQPGTQVPEGPGPQSPGDQGPDPPGEDQDNIPQRLRDANPGKQFYCPHCLHNVSGGNASACRRHRQAPCNIVGHTYWRIGTAEDRTGWQAAKRKGKNSAPKRAPPKSGSGDPTYKPPGDKGTDEGGDEGGGDASQPPGPRRTGRKRKQGGNIRDGGNGAGPSNKRQKQ